MPMRYIGNPLVDMGVATLTAAAGASEPSEVTTEQITTFVERDLLDVYITPFMSNYLGTVVFANANFANPSINNKPKFDVVRKERLRAWAILYQPDAPLPDGAEPPDPDEQCAFSGDPADLRVSRTLIPMIGSEDAINFVPMGRPRLPVAGWVLLALLAMPYGTLNSGGQVLLPHTLDYDLLRGLAKANLDANRRVIQMEGINKRPNYRFARTKMLEQLVQLWDRHSGSYPITVYRFTSAAQNARIEIFSLSTQVIKFIGRAQRQHSQAWGRILAQAWDNKPADPEINSKGEKIYERRNFIYEDLFDLPQQAHRFLRTYLLRKPPKERWEKADPRLNYRPLTPDAHGRLIDWGLTTLFLEMIMNIEKSRVQSIRDFADRLADYILNHDARLYRDLYLARRPHQLRQVIISAANRAREKRLESLVPLDMFMEVFFVDDGVSYREDYYLAVDLLFIRIIEQLTADWIERNTAMLQEIDQKASEYLEETN